MSGFDEERARFAREQQAMARLTGHPNILPVLHVGETASGYPYLVMPFCSQGSTQERIDRLGVLEVAEVLRLGVKMAGPWRVRMRWALCTVMSSRETSCTPITASLRYVISVSPVSLAGLRPTRGVGRIAGVYRPGDPHRRSTQCGGPWRQPMTSKPRPMRCRRWAGWSWLWVTPAPSWIGLKEAMPWPNPTAIGRCER
jgi:hypothetical protein